MIDADELASAVARVNQIMASHAGAIAIERTGTDSVTVRFVGMCTGCPARATTMAGTVRPALLAVAGVERLDIAGYRISDESAARLDALLTPHLGRKETP